MKSIRILALALAAVAVPACHNDHDTFILYIYVDPVFGNDFFGDGTPRSPLRSITRAMHFAISGDVVFLAPGTYSTSTGEVFPIGIKAGVLVEGDPATKGVGPSQTFVSGGGLYTIGGGTQASTTVTTAFVLGTGAALSGVKITVTGAGGVGLVCDGLSSSVSNCTITGCGASGIRVYQTCSPGFTGNVITLNAANGIDVFDDAAPTLRQNTITSNVDGVAANDASAPNLGDAVTPGANTLQANTGVGLNNNTTASTVQAVGNTWRPSTQGADASGHYAAALTPGAVAPAAANNFAITNAAGAIQF